jgi:hypothetical protein
VRLGLMWIAMLPLACGAEPLVPPAQLGLDATYTVSRCTFGDPVPPCLTFLSGISQHHLDSARLVLHRDGSATWMAATRTQVCEVGRPCQYSADLEQHAATYAVLPAGIQIFRLNTGRPDSIIEFGAHIPDRVPATWAGPDTLQFGHNGGTTRAVTFGRVQ